MPRSSLPLAVAGLGIAFAVPALEFAWGFLINANAVGTPSTQAVMAMTPWLYIAAALAPVGFGVVVAAMRSTSVAGRVLVFLSGVPVAIGAWVGALLYFSFAVGEPF